ncbi:hypothetical protein N0V90_008104 [Kalmusia sp. IMI 367209]|nr:hypothetical protein N0V90_008104 [Kalmusia sp. IMI 367209]
MECPVISSSADVVRVIQDQNIDVAEYVPKCDNVCPIIFGAGNPDISGPGLMIAYTYQAIITCLTCMTPLLIALLKGHSSPYSSLISSFIRKLRKVFLGMSAFFAISLLVASIVRFKQLPPILEVYIALKLNALQTYILYCSAFIPIYERFFAGNRSIMRTAFWYFLIGIGKDFFLWPITVPKSTILTYRGIARACHEHRDAPDLSAMFVYDSIQQFDLKHYSFMLQLLMSMLLEITFSFLEIIRPSTLRDMARKHGWVLHGLVALSGFPLSLALYLKQLGKARDTVKRASGDEYKDDEWGYGQTTAVLLMLPFAWKVAVETLRLLKGFGRAAATDAGRKDAASIRLSAGAVSCAEQTSLISESGDISEFELPLSSE